MNVALLERGELPSKESELPLSLELKICLEELGRVTVSPDLQLTEPHTGYPNKPFFG